MLALINVVLKSVTNNQACIKLRIPPWGKKIKGFGDGEENQKLEKKKKENF